MKYGLPVPYKYPLQYIYNIQFTLINSTTIITMLRRTKLIVSIDVWSKFQITEWNQEQVEDINNSSIPLDIIIQMALMNTTKKETLSW